MNCRPDCAACCIYPSISSPLPGMPDGKPAMVPCVHLTENMQCSLFGKPERPGVCIGFKPESWMCGKDAREAIANFMWLLEN